MVDAKAQTNVLTDARFVPFIACSNSIQLISEIFQRLNKTGGRKRLSPVVQFMHHGLSLHVIAHSNGNHQPCIDMMVQMQVLALVQQ
jgi:hypothetical protein